MRGKKCYFVSSINVQIHIVDLNNLVLQTRLVSLLFNCSVPGINFKIFTYFTLKPFTMTLSSSGVSVFHWIVLAGPR